MISENICSLCGQTVEDITKLLSGFSYGPFNHGYCSNCKIYICDGCAIKKQIGEPGFSIKIFLCCPNCNKSIKIMGQTGHWNQL